MSTNGYTQLVNNPTTAKGTLIDHVYYNKRNDSVILEVHDTYYSILGFEKYQRQQLESYYANGIPFTLTNCQIQHNNLFCVGLSVF